MRTAAPFCGTTPIPESASARVIQDFDQHQHHSKMVDHLHQKFHAVQWSNMADTKPDSDASQRRGQALSPMRVVDLEAGAVHTGRSITGQIMRAGVYTGGSYFVLQDVFGSAVKVGVYYPTGDPKGGGSPRRAKTDFHLGRHVRIAEPFFKRGMDGKPFVRIDKPSDDIAFIGDPRPADGAAWHALGNQFYACKHSSAAGARGCWNRAVTLLGGTAATLLSNRSAAYLGLNLAAPAALDAGAALLLDSTSQKAAFRLAAALSRMPNQQDNSKALARLCIARFPDVKMSFKALLETTSGASAKDVRWCASGPWWEDEAAMSFLAAEAGRPLAAPTSASSASAAPSGGESVAPRPSRWEELKRDGNTHFGQARFKEAVAAYSQALNALFETETLVKLLCNLALVAGPDPLSPLEDATCALVLRPSHLKAWARRVSALQVLGGRDDAVLTSCKAGHAAANAALVSQSGPADSTSAAAVEAAVRGFLNAEEMVHAKQKAGRSHRGLSTEEQRAQRKEMHAPEGYEAAAGSAASIAQMSMFRNLLQRMPASKQMAMFGRKLEKLPDVEIEILKHGGGWPVGVDRQWATSHLRRGFEENSTAPLTMEFYLKSAEYHPPTKDLYKRLGTNHPAKMQWWLESRSQDVFDEAVFGIELKYSPWTRHAFSNEIYRKLVLTRGTTHVAVGFVDLGILLASELKDGEAGAAASASAPASSSPLPVPVDDTLRFIGVEASGYSVAKTLVIWEMLRQTPPLSHLDRQAHLRAVLQAWFSTTWTAGTPLAVANALAALRSSAQAKRQPKSVQRMLHHWAGSAGVSLCRARAEHAKSIGPSRHYAHHLLRLPDRVAMAKYELTGDVGVGAHPSCGSVLWFDCPDGTPPPENDESVLGTLEFTAVVEAVQRVDGTISIFEAAEQLLLESLHKLAGWATSGHLSVQLTCARFEEVVEYITAQRPWTMSWSNVLDYFAPAEFHKLARACSRHGGTVHFGSSINWPRNVQGANVLDIKDAGARAQVLDEAAAWLRSVYERVGVRPYLRCPPPENPINNASRLLEPRCFPAWAVHWFGIAKRGGHTTCWVPDQTMGRCSFRSPLTSTGACSVHFAWTYDSKVSSCRLSAA